MPIRPRILSPDHRRWLLGELDAWLADGLVDHDQAAAIRARYPESQGDSWGRLVLTAIGAIVFGLGVILFFAYNWADMPRITKLGVVVSGLVAAHGGGWWLARRERPIASVEAAHLLGTMLFGAGLWLVAQAYHIDPIEPAPLLVWGLGALAAAWALASIPQAVVAVLLVVGWSFEVGFRDTHLLPSAIVALGVLPLALRQRSKPLAFIVAAALLVLVPTGVGVELERLVVVLVLSMTVAYLGLGALARHVGRDELGPLAPLGLVVHLGMLFAFSFPEVVGELGGPPENPAQWFLFLGPLVVAIGLAGYAATLPARLERGAGLVLAAGTAAYVALLHADWGSGDDLLAAVPFSFVLVGHGLLLILDGSHRQSWQRVTLGCAVVSLLVGVRFVDWFDSLLLRSLAFLLLGVGIYAVGRFYQHVASTAEADHA